MNVNFIEILTMGTDMPGYLVKDYIFYPENCTFELIHILNRENEVVKLETVLSSMCRIIDDLNSRLQLLEQHPNA